MKSALLSLKPLGEFFAKHEGLFEVLKSAFYLAAAAGLILALVDGWTAIVPRVITPNGLQPSPYESFHLDVGIILGILLMVIINAAAGLAKWIVARTLPKEQWEKVLREG